MFINKTFAVMLIIGLLFGNIIAQQAKTSIIKPPEISAELRKNAVEFLRQTIKDISDLKAEENRQFFTIEAARLLWKYDEKEARKMFEGAMKSVKQSIAKVVENYQKNVEEIKKRKADLRIDYGVNGYVNGVNVSANVSPEVSIYETGQYFEFDRIAKLRKSLLENLIEVDADLAYQFLSETDQMIPKSADNYAFSSTYNPFELKIIPKLLKENKVDKSIEIARKMLEKDFSANNVAVLDIIYQKDAVKGNLLAEETLQKLRSSVNKTDISYSEVSLFFDEAIQNKKQPTPMLSEKSLKDLAKLLGQKVLAEMQNGGYYLNPSDYAKKIKEYAPREALNILQKSKQNKRPDRYAANAAVNAATNAARAAMNAAMTAANAVSIAANKAANAPANAKKTNSKPTKLTENIDPILLDEVELTMETKEGLIQKLQIGKFTDEERKDVIKKAKEYAVANNPWGYTRPEGFVGVVSELCRFSLYSADKEISDELMKEAEVYVRPENKSFLDYAARLFLAGGYSSHHPDKSFQIMESLTPINEYIDHAIKLGTFFDVDSTYIPNGEVSAAFFLSEFRITRSISNELELPVFIQNLSKANFKRTTGLADKFERAEFKMAARMLILESLLGEFPKPINDYNDF